MKASTKKTPARPTADPDDCVVQEQLELYDALREPGKRKSPDGITTSRLICSAHVGLNEDVFPVILELHVPPGSVVADVTHGTGIFWKKVPGDKYRLLATDIRTGVDCRKLPYDD